MENAKKRQRGVKFPTFAGADHLQHHLCGPAVVQPGLLIKHLLLLHFLLLRERRYSEPHLKKKKKKKRRPSSFPHLKCLLLSFLLFFTFGTALKGKTGTCRSLLNRGRSNRRGERVTFAIMSAYAMYKGSSSKELTQKKINMMISYNWIRLFYKNILQRTFIH